MASPSLKKQNKINDSNANNNNPDQQGLPGRGGQRGDKK